MKSHRTTSDVHQKAATIALHEAAGVPLDVAVGADEIKAFQQVLPQYRIIVIYTGRNHEAVAFSPHDPNKKQLILVHVDDHYHGCTSLQGYRQNDYVCPYCLKGYNHAGQHRCQAEDNIKFCLCCRREDCKEFIEAKPQGLKPQMKCKDCGRYFYGETCYRNHLKFGMDGKINHDNAICHNIRRCIRCKKINRSKRAIKEHKCGYAACPTCDDYVRLKDHRCFIESGEKIKKKRKAESEAKKNAKKAKTTGTAAAAPEDFMAEEEPQQRNPKTDQEPIESYFDIEARQDEGTHVANLLVYQDSVGGQGVLVAKIVSNVTSNI